MAVFRFKLESILRQRTQVEQQRQYELAESQRKELRLQADIDAIVAVARSSRAELRAGTRALSASVLAAHQRFDQATRTKLAGLRRELGEARQGVAQARTSLLIAATARKAIEKLRERAQARFIVAQRRRQRTADEELTAGYL